MSTSVCLHAHVCVRDMCAWVHMRKCATVRLRHCVYVSVCACVPACMCGYVCECVYVCVRILCVSVWECVWIWKNERRLHQPCNYVFKYSDLYNIVSSLKININFGWPIYFLTRWAYTQQDLWEVYYCGKYIIVPY